MATNQPATTNRVYDPTKAAVFQRTAEAFGCFSNMSPELGVYVNGRHHALTEAVYQALKFSHRPDIQEKIFKERNPMTGKDIAWQNSALFDHSFLPLRMSVMRWIVRLKIASNWDKAISYIDQTKDLPIVERSSRDDYWAAKPQSDGTLQGQNFLGRLWMEARRDLAELGDQLKIVPPPARGDSLRLFGEPLTLFDATTIKPAPAPVQLGFGFR